MSFQRPDIIRPPSEWKSYYLPLTGGCSNNTCAFCSWHGSKLHLRDLEEVKQEIDALSLFMGRGVKVPTLPPVAYMVAGNWDGRRIFLQDGDALVYPFPRLKEALIYLNQKFPHLERIATYATPLDVLRRSPAELKELRDLKLSIFYLGVESGDDRILKDIGKGATRDQIVEAGRKVKAAGIELSVSVILGLGGVARSDEHARATAQILSEIDPDYAGALTLTFVPGTPLYERCESGTFKPISPFESLQELRTIVANASFTNCFFSSMHASNYFTVRGQLPQDKELMLRQLEQVLKRHDDALLRPEYMRGL